MVPRMIIIREKACHDNGQAEKLRFEGQVTAASGEEHEVEFDLPYKQAANALMQAPGYAGYVKAHGYHFTDALAEHVSRMMINASGLSHTWTAAQVKKAMEGLGLTIPGNVTLGDVTYLANMYYSDFYPDPLKDEASCLRAAYKIANDPDGYEGMVFCRWTSDAIGKSIRINWEDSI